MSESILSSEPISSDTMAPDRLASFRSEIDQLKVSGGVAKYEQVGAIVGLVGLVVGIVIAFIAWSSAKSAGDFETIHRNQIFAQIGVAIAIVGTLVWVRNSITRHLRWWNIRMVYEQRQQTDRLIAALERHDTA